jgi:hypothetical protein
MSALGFSKILGRILPVKKQVSLVFCSLAASDGLHNLGLVWSFQSIASKIVSKLSTVLNKKLDIICNGHKG